MLRAVSKFGYARDSRDTRRRSLRGVCTSTLERLCVFCLLIVFLAEIRHYSKFSLKHFECMLPFSNGWGVHSFLKGHRSWTTMQMLYHRLAALKENLQGLLFVPQAFPIKLKTAYPGDSFFYFLWKSCETYQMDRKRRASRHRNWTSLINQKLA